jgi:asparagine synthase (glutamine-hydrolysing)
MKAGILFSGGKDSCYSAYLAKKAGYELVCLITIYSQNQDSYMFHTPSIDKTKKQAEVMNIPLMTDTTKGEKEIELEDLERAIATAKEEYGIDTVVTGALHSEYQASRIQKICDKLDLKCFNPLWHKKEIEYLNELIENKFKIIVTGVAAFPLNESWLGREINKEFVEEVTELKEKYKIHPAGEGGEFETFVLDCPLFEKPLEVKDKKVSGEGNAWRMEVELK